MNLVTTIINKDYKMTTRGGKRENAGRHKGEPTKTIRVPIGAVEAIEAFIRLYTDKAKDNDFVVLNIATAKTKWCLDRGDFTNTQEIKTAVREMRKEAERLDNTRHDQPNASIDWDEAERIGKLADEWEKISTIGLDS